MIAALPMHDAPATAAALDALWAGTRDRLRARGMDAPEALSRDIGLEAGWAHPALLLGHTCSLPFRAWLKDAVQVVGAFDLGLPDTPAGYYRSAIVVGLGVTADRLADLDGARLAVNQAHSHSGWAAIHAEMADLGIAPGAVVMTGAHSASAAAVAQGRADFAALDVASLRLIRRADPDVAARLRVIGHTAASPGLPLITRRGRDPAPLFAALAATLAAQPDTRAALGVHGLIAVPERAYLALPIPPAP